MRKFFSLALIVMVSLFTIPLTLTYAQEAPPAESVATEPVLKPEDVKEIREAAKAIQEIFGDHQDSPLIQNGATPVSTTPASIPPQPPAPEKNMAEVADKALSILSNYIGSAAKAMQEVAPEVWRVMIRQQYANAIAGPLVPALLIGFVGLYTVFTKKWWPKPEKVDWNTSDITSKQCNWTARQVLTTVGPFLVFILLSVDASLALRSSIQMLINPEYYAFRDLLQLILQRGSL